MKFILLDMKLNEIAINYLKEWRKLNEAKSSNFGIFEF